MIQRPNVADEAQMKQEFRRLYAEIGFEGCTQVFYEMMVAANWMAEVMLEERWGAQK